MKFKDFLLELDLIGCGVVAFNTYKLHAPQRSARFNFYLMVAVSGNKGRFWKVEDAVDDMEKILDIFIEVIKKDEIK